MTTSSEYHHYGLSMGESYIADAKASARNQSDELTAAASHLSTDAATESSADSATVDHAAVVERHMLLQPAG